MGSGSSRKVKAVPAIVRSFRPERMSTFERNNGETAGSESHSETNTTVSGSTTDQDGVMENKATDEQVDENINSDLPACLYGSASSKWPIRCFVKTGFNVNAQHGGCTALYFVLCAYGGKGEDTTAEMALVRSGFDCNHVAWTSLSKCHKGHFGPENGVVTDELGELIGSHMFGHNHVMMLTNDCRYGNLRNGVYVEGTGDGRPCVLPLKVNESAMTMLLCSGTKDGTVCSGVYMIRLGFKDNHFQQKLICGDDEFKIDLDSNRVLSVTGPGTCFYGIFNNRDNLTSKSVPALVALTQAYQGSIQEQLLEKVGQGHTTLVVLCSNSNGTEDSTVSALYHVSTLKGKLVAIKHISGSHGDSYETSDLWTFHRNGEQLVIKGPDGPCRYAVLSNIKATNQALVSLNKQQQAGCLATGESKLLMGNVKVTQNDFTCEVNMPVSICIMFDHVTVETVDKGSLRKMGDKYTVTHKWTGEQKAIGYHMVRAFAVRNLMKSAVDGVFIELSGSPYSLTIQKPGVVYALNCAGPAYQAVNDVTYGSEFSQFANFSNDFNFGCQSRALGGIKHESNIPQSLLKTFDGFLHVSMRSTGVEATDEQGISYKVSDIPNGSYRLRVHLNSPTPRRLKFNGSEISGLLTKAYKKNTSVGDCVGNAGYVGDVAVQVKDNKIEVSSTEIMISGFALLDNAYEEKSLSETEINEQEAEKQMLADKVAQLNTSSTQKEMTIVGWSPNFLQNASGEAGDLSHWNISGDVKTTEGGYNTEKAFVTSHMWSEKYQEVNLLEHFSAEYLDTAPPIQVSEWYREGCIGGGFYCLTAKLLSQNGKTLTSYSTGEQGNLYKDSKWFEATTTFSDYGPGVRIIAFSSKGKDDKHWAGHYGPKMSGAQVRVKRETVQAEGDKYADVIHLSEEDSSQKAGLDKLVSGVLSSDNRDLLQDLVEEKQLPVDHSFEKQTEIVVPPVKTKQSRKRKKREIRVFVSSTFRDFGEEREEIIKKAFREVNRLCMDRGVFFTYVDLRWGITSEQTSHGKTIAICLQEIERCRPYFICLMGERFGWSQKRGTTDKVLDASFDYALENYPELQWIDKHRHDTSVTQLEVFHGVLNNPTECAARSFFYLRDPPDQAELSEEEFKRRTSESPWHHERQEWLKSEVKRQSEIKVANFKSAAEVADMVKVDLELCVEQEFPKGTELTKLQQQNEAHAAFAAVRQRVYIGRAEYFTTINEARENNITQPFVLLGESGCGKSALVANWAKKVEDEEPGVFLFVHFIGSSADSANYIKLLRRLFEEMKAHFHLDLAIPSSDTLLIHEFGKWLTLAGSRSKIVIVLDALNQLDDGSGDDGNEHDVLWIPKELPANVFVLLSTLPGRAMEACKGFGWPSMKVEPLASDQKLQIITDYLEGIYGKTLNSEQKQMLVGADQTNNPLYLRSLLDEVRMYGSFRTLTDKIADYLKADSPGDLFAKILERLEDDFETGPTGRERLIQDATTALWCSNRGMSEAELVELLWVPSAVWSPFYLSLAENIVNRNGILNFFHDHLRQAVENKYLSSNEAKRAGYLRLADFFGAKDTDNRTVEELPFLLTRANEIARLKSTVSDLDVFYRLSESEDGTFELVKAWKRISPDFSEVEPAYHERLAKIPREEIAAQATYYCRLYSHMGQFYLNLGLMEAARSIYETLIQQLELQYEESHGTVVYNAYNQSWRYRCKHPDVVKSLHELGTVYMKLGDYPKAVKVYLDAISRQNRVETPSQKLQLAEGLLGLATVYVLQDNMAQAKKLMVRALELSTQVLGMTHHFVAAIFTKLGQLSYKQGRIDEALGYYLQDLKVTRSEVGTHHPRTATVLNEIALVYDDKHDPLAGKLYEAALLITLDTYGNNFIGTGIVRYNLGAHYFGTNHFARAKYQFHESHKIHQMFLGDDHPDTLAVNNALDEVSRMVN